MPNAVDISKIPEYDGSPPAEKSFARQKIIGFNAAFAAMLNQARASLPGITIYVPDFFSLFDNILTNAAAYGLTNALDEYGFTVGALQVDSLDKSLDGPGTNYIFWDNMHPTAKAHMVLADVVQQLISPVRISRITAAGGSNRLDVANIPIGRNGVVEARTNLALGSWTTVQTITSTNATQTIFVPASGPLRYYRLRFPFAWSWP
jgi:phospholipase/lecithinase/hemolysin